MSDQRIMLSAIFVSSKGADFMSTVMVYLPSFHVIPLQGSSFPQVPTVREASLPFIAYRTFSVTLVILIGFSTFRAPPSDWDMISAMFLLSARVNSITIAEKGLLCARIVAGGQVICWGK
jgi:hypothetical protein